MVSRIFIDSDIVISSILSSSGAAHFIINQSPIKPVISNFSVKELRTVVNSMNLDSQKLETLIKNRFEVFLMTKNLDNLKQAYRPYVTDINDAHIVAGAHSAESKYLITYNLKHYKLDKIKDKLNIIILTPALFLQYLRSQ